MKHTYIEYHRPDVDGFLVKCDTARCPSPACEIIGMKMLCKTCAMLTPHALDLLSHPPCCPLFFKQGIHNKDCYLAQPASQ